MSSASRSAARGASTDISVAHSNDAIARTFQEPSPRLVVPSLRFSIMHVPRARSQAVHWPIEIHNKAVQYVLSPKLEPEDSAVAHQGPGVTLSWRRAGNWILEMWVKDHGEWRVQMAQITSAKS